MAWNMEGKIKTREKFQIKVVRSIDSVFGILV